MGLLFLAVLLHELGHCFGARSVEGDAQEILLWPLRGLASIEDVKALLQPRAEKLAGAIAGRALYDGRLDAAEALRLLRAGRNAA